MSRHYYVVLYNQSSSSFVLFVDCVPGVGLFLSFVLDNETEADFITLINYTFISRLIFQTLLGDTVIYDMPQEQSFHIFFIISWRLIIAHIVLIYTYISFTRNIELP